MWPDNETDVDFLNFSGVANTIAEIIVQAQGRPVSIGVSGAWGIGKSSMIKLVRASLAGRDEQKYLFVDFNAWLYQGYDDVRAALVEIIAKEVEKESRRQEKATDKAKALLKRVNWLRIGKLAAGAASAAFGLPPVGLIGELVSLGKSIVTADVDQAVLKQIQSTGAEVFAQAAGLLNEEKSNTPPEAIHLIREGFEEALEELDVTLVVLIDDLDRCLPETTISTLEAVRLFLFLKNTAFVIAADTGMIKHAVRKHFDFQAATEDYVTNYFDKLIQVPIRVPPLGTQEVRAYLMLLFVENSSLSSEVKTNVRERVCKQLSLTWKGCRVDRAFMDSLGVDFPEEIVAKFDTAERLAPLMTSASDIRGNPRLIKRFLNALAIRMTIAKSHDVSVDEAVLAKLLLFERCGDTEAYGTLINAVSSDARGRPEFLADWEAKLAAGEELRLDKPWDSPFVLEWIVLRPPLAQTDLRGALYVSREHAPLITPEDRLSSHGMELLIALLEHPDMAGQLRDALSNIPRTELTIILDRLLEQARQIQEWGIPDILEACLVVTRVDVGLGKRLAGFLGDRPHGQLTPAIVSKIDGEPWADGLFKVWAELPAQNLVAKAIKRRQKNGNL